MRDTCEIVLALEHLGRVAFADAVAQVVREVLELLLHRRGEREARRFLPVRCSHNFNNKMGEFSIKSNNFSNIYYWGCIYMDLDLDFDLIIINMVKERKQ